MDIRQILEQAEAIEFTALGKEKTQAKITELESQIGEIQTYLNSLTRISNAGINRIYEIRQAEIAKENAQEQERLKEQGIKVGDIYYIDRHDGVYVISEIDKDWVVFDRYMEGESHKKWGRGKTCRPDRFDPRLTPLRTQGPFKVGTIVCRNGKEFEVMGYLGYRMVLKGINLWGQSYYTIIQKKDEHTYKSIII